MISDRVGMIQMKCCHSISVNIISIKACEARLTEAFCDTTSPAEKINRG
jgi:hypothetical protein